MCGKCAGAAGCFGNRSTTYNCDGLDFTVHFRGDEVDVVLPQRTIVLLRVPAASGDQFRNGDDSFWGKGDTAILEADGRAYSDCVVPRARSPWEDAKLRGVDFRAAGNAPGWSVELVKGKDATVAIDGDARRRTFAVSDPTVAGKRTTYRVRDTEGELTLTLDDAACRDAKSGEAFDTQVRMRVGQREWRGCGRWLQRSTHGY